MENEDKIKIINDEGKEVEVELLNVVEVDGKEFMLYSTEVDSEYDDIYALKIVKDESGAEDLVALSEEEENLISDVIDELISENN